MRMSLILAITSPTAFLEVNKTPSIILAMQSLQSVDPSLPLTVALSPELSLEMRSLLKEMEYNIDVLVCMPSDPRSFADALQPSFGDFDALLIHDTSRPLVDREQFLQVLDAFDADVDAVRPAIPFTETLKILSADSVIMETLDRSTVLRISTPELIRVSAIEVNDSDCGWFLPLKMGARTKHIEGSPDGVRINTSADCDLLELHQS